MRLLSAAAALALMSGVAMAQSTAPSPTAPTSPAPVNPDPTAVAPADQTVPPDPSAATSMPADPSAATTLPAPAPAPTGTAADTAATVPASSMPAEQQAGLKAGDPGVTANPPIADTPQNRQLYGKPLSNAGRRSTPNGN
ncbi:hypothetical protein [Caulobacter sp. LARHSG274]